MPPITELPPPGPSDSWKFIPLVDPAPVVMITSPADDRLRAHGNKNGRKW